MVLHLGDCLVAAKLMLLLSTIITCGFYYVLHQRSGLGHSYVPRSYNYNFSQGSNRFVDPNLTTDNLVQEQRKQQITERIDVAPRSTSSDSIIQISNLTLKHHPTNESIQSNSPSEQNINIQQATNDSFEETSGRFPSGSSEQLCDMTRFKSWRQGVVTEMKPVIRRNCGKIAENDKEEIDRVTHFLKDWKNEESDAQFVLRMSNCSNVMEEFSNNFYVSPEERNFPLAFIFVVYTNVRQVVRLLKAIYRPHNLYCIHPDVRQGDDFARIFHQISKCLDNVFVASKLEKVYYMHHSILDAQLNCVQDLLKYDQSKWRYAINLVGRELPLQTNRDIVKLLKRASNVSIVDSHPIEDLFFNERFQFKWTVNTATGSVHSTRQKLSAIPHAIKIYKGSTHFALTWQFAHFLLTNQKSIDFRQYLNDVWIPEEEFYASLYHISEAEKHGGYSRNVTLPISYLEVSIWLLQTNPLHHKKKRKRKMATTVEHCSGLNVHAVCVVATGDLSRVYKIGLSQNRFFFNKYFMEFDHVIMDCMEERLVQQNELEYAQDVECLLPSEE